ncbi:hypothetical protein L218DRAFT_101609 [Marasmius fiardii PR-910]|nr:hypothetical protein L218DRAFT_101609 [Marasmius fiardii PR-910]
MILGRRCHERGNIASASLSSHLKSSTPYVFRLDWHEHEKSWSHLENDSTRSSRSTLFASSGLVSVTDISSLRRRLPKLAFILRRSISCFRIIRHMRFSPLYCNETPLRDLLQNMIFRAFDCDQPNSPFLLLQVRARNIWKSKRTRDYAVQRVVSGMKGTCSERHTQSSQSCLQLAILAFRISTKTHPLHHETPKSSQLWNVSPLQQLGLEDVGLD